MVNALIGQAGEMGRAEERHKEEADTMCAQLRAEQRMTLRALRQVSLKFRFLQQLVFAFTWEAFRMLIHKPGASEASCLADKKRQQASPA